MRSVAALFGLGADALLGEPPVSLHPVVHFGTAMTSLEQRIYAPRRSNGIALVVCGVALGAGTGLLLTRLLGPPMATGVAVGFCSAGRMLDSEALMIAGWLDTGDLEQARHRLPALVGRDPSSLGSGEISRAVIESLAENGVDAVVSTLFWAAVGGAPAAIAHRAANTLDAMVGHRNDRYEDFGWAAARLDDALNWVPARLMALGVIVARPSAATRVVRVVRRDSSKHPSPNGGVAEAAFAAALDVQLGGRNTYGDTVEDRGTLGDGRSATADDVTAAVRLRRHATLAVAATLVVGESIAKRYRAANPIMG